MRTFPEGFLWGAATSAHQVEGDNVHSDWWAWEQKGGGREPSGKACNHYFLYAQDFDLARALAHNAHRFSIEWSRIEPREGEFSPEGLAHYKAVVQALKDRGLEPIVTLHHFTNPLWFARKGGWKQGKAPEYFLRYVAFVAKALGRDVRYWVTINEPLVYTYYSYLVKAWPPQESSALSAWRVRRHLARAHIGAYNLIHSIHREQGFPAPQVSIAQNVQAFEACFPTLKNRLAVRLRERFINFDFVDALARARTLDFIGLNYYSRNLVETYSWRLRHMFNDVCMKGHRPLPQNSMGWDIYPEGLYRLLSSFGRRYPFPLCILENGICTDDDGLRWEYIRSHLESVHRAMEEGVRVLGYLYWSLLDNYEWDKGFAQRFGLIEVDYSGFRRTVRESARRFAAVCATRTLA